MKRRTLNEEERDLWRRAMRDVSPAKFPQRPTPLFGGAGVRLLDQRRAPASYVPQSAATLPPHFVFGGGDPKRDRAAARRRIPLERTLDLHGLTQVEAHRLLVRFIAGAASDGVRLALVITGKGRPSQPGVLRERFLDWVEEGTLKGAIARVAPAHPRDGGAGAFYVFLKAKGAGAGPSRR